LKLDSNGVNEHGIAMCECGNKRPHAWEPGESCGDRVIPGDRQKAAPPTDPHTEVQSDQVIISLDRADAERKLERLRGIDRPGAVTREMTELLEAALSEPTQSQEQSPEGGDANVYEQARSASVRRHVGGGVAETQKQSATPSQSPGEAEAKRRYEARRATHIPLLPLWEHLSEAERARAIEVANQSPGEVAVLGEKAEEAAAQAIAAHVEIPEEAQPDLYRQIANEALRAALGAADPAFPPARFAHRFQEDGWPR
jgi:hypothetical protein